MELTGRERLGIPTEKFSPSIIGLKAVFVDAFFKSKDTELTPSLGLLIAESSSGRRWWGLSFNGTS